jgi:hypothetical protein
MRLPTWSEPILCLMSKCMPQKSGVCASTCRACEQLLLAEQRLLSLDGILTMISMSVGTQSNGARSRRGTALLCTSYLSRNRSGSAALPPRGCNRCLCVGIARYRRDQRGGALRSTSFGEDNRAQAITARLPARLQPAIRSDCSDSRLDSQRSLKNRQTMPPAGDVEEYPDEVEER